MVLLRSLVVKNNMARATRREFLRAVGAGLVSVVGARCNVPLQDESTAWAGTSSRSKLVIARHEKFLGGDGEANGGLIGKALDDGLMRLSGIKSPDKAWASLFKPDDVVGLKLNCLAKRSFSPHVELVESIIRGLKLAGVREGNIIIFDRTSKELKEAC